jgi:hypothetical protein
MTRGNDVAQSTGSTEPRCVRPATSPWPTRHVLAHFQKPFFLHVQQKWCSRYPMPKERCKEETWPPGQVAWPTGLTSGSPSPNLRSEHHLTPPINTMVLPLTKSVKKVRFSPPPQGASKFNLCRVLGVARAWKLYRNLFGVDGVF